MMYAFVTRFGMSGWRAPWSMTMPLTSCVSMSLRCCMSIFSIMCRSTGLPSSRIVSTATWRALPRGGLTGVDDALGDVVGESLVQLGAEGGTCELDEERAIDGRLVLGVVEHAQRHLLGQVEALGEHARVDACDVDDAGGQRTLGHVLLGQLEEFADEEHGRRGAVARHVVLRRARLADHGGGRMLDVLRRGMSSTRGALTILCRSTLPSLVSCRSPEPDTSLSTYSDYTVGTHILMVPFGPRLDFMTSWRPRAPLTFSSSAMAARTSSAFGFNVEMLDMADDLRFFREVSTISANDLRLNCACVQCFEKVSTQCIRNSCQLVYCAVTPLHYRIAPTE